MSQTLKDDIKEKILENSKIELLEKGFENANMRNIAKSSNISVGNLYRYFKSKDEINNAIVSDVLNQINELVMFESSNTISLLNSNEPISLNNKKLRTMFDNLTIKLVDIYKNHKIEFNILMMNSSLNINLLNWFSSIIKSVILINYDIPTLYQEIETISKAYAVAIFDGMKVIFKDNNLKDDQLQNVVRIYFRSYINMLEFDLSNYTGGAR